MKIIHKYKLFGYINTLPRSGRRPKLSPTDDRKLVRMFRNHQGSSLSWNGNCWNATITLLSEVSFTSPCHHELQGCPPKQQPLFQNWQPRMKFAASHTDKPNVFWRCFMITWEMSFQAIITRYLFGGVNVRISNLRAWWWWWHHALI